MLPNDVLPRSQVSQRFMRTLMLLPVFLLYCSLVFRVLESHYSISWVQNRQETAARKGQFMGVLFLKASALQLPRTRVTKCEFQEKPEEVTKCAKSLLAMQTINLFNLHSPCSEPKRKKGIKPKTGSLRYRSLQNNSSGFLFDIEIGRPV